MSYISSHLIDQEVLVCQGKQSLIVLLPQFLFCFLLLCSYIYLHEMLVVLVATLLYTFFVFRFSSLEFGLTNIRLIVKRGLFSRDIMEMKLSAVESVEVKQSFFERIFSVGQLVITGNGTHKETIAYVKDPLLFKNAFLEQKK